MSAFSGPLTLAQHDLLREQGDRDEYNKLYHQLLLEAPLRIHFNTPQQSFAFLFGGIGDARHLFESLFELADLCPSPTPKCFHFTMVDIKVTALARDLVMFYIFKHLSQFSLEQMQHDVAAIEVCSLLTLSRDSLIYIPTGTSAGTLYLLRHSNARLSS